MKPRAAVLFLLAILISSCAAPGAAGAYELCTNGVADCPGSAPPIAELALVTDSQYGQIDSSGAVSLPMQRRLAWVFTWEAIGCPRRLGPRPPSAAPSAGPCDWVVLIDAATGDYLLTYSGPSRR